MFIFKNAIFLFGICFINSVLTKPVDDNLENRGFGSTLWGWITYPFSWWTSGSVDSLPNNDRYVITSTPRYYDNIEIGKRNVTVWCNDQTCTTMRCDKNGCYNMTCNIYDTDLMGECRIYNIITTPIAPIHAESIPQTGQQDIATETISKKPEISTQSLQTVKSTEESIVEQPLELEAVMSSTITEGNANLLNNKSHLSSPNNKV